MAKKKVDKKGYTKVGTTYIRGTWYSNVLADGVEKGVWGKAIPPLASPVRYWISGVGIGQTAVVPTAAMPLHIRGVCGEVRMGQDAVETDDFDATEFLDRYFDPRMGEAWKEDDGDAPSKLGLPHAASGTRSRGYAKKELFSNTIQLGLPDKAVFADASLMHYVHKFKQSGLVNQRAVAIDSASALLVGINAQIATDQTDQSTALFGGSTSVQDLYKDLVVSLNPDFSSQTGMFTPTSGLFDWLSEGVREAAVDDVTTSLTYRIKGTVQLDVYSLDVKKQVLSAYR